MTIEKLFNDAPKLPDNITINKKDNQTIEQLQNRIEELERRIDLLEEYILDKQIASTKTDIKTDINK